MYGVFHNTYNRTWLHMWRFSAGSPEASPDEESMLRAEWLEASANDAAAAALEQHWVMAVQEKGLGWISHRSLGTVESSRPC